MVILFLLFIVVIIMLSISNSKLSNRVAALQQELKKQNKSDDDNNYCPQCGFYLKGLHDETANSTNPTISYQNNIQPSNVVINKPPKSKPEMSEREIKNSTILTVGAILVIVSAIVFLTSTWNTSLDIVKTLIIFFMFLVFLGSSVIADKYLHIKETAKVFLYIALSYLPLVFFSVSLFHLLGDYLSINGEGKYIYLFISSAILSLIYFFVSKRKKDIFCGVGSIIFQTLSIILFSLIFSNDITLIFVFLAIYNLLFHYLYTNKTYYFNEKVHNYIKNILTISIFISSIFFLTEYNFHESLNWSIVLFLIIMYFNHYYLLKDSEESKEVFSYTGPIHILITSLLTAYVFNGEFITYQMLLIAGIIISYFLDYIKDKEISLSNFIISSIFYIIVYLVSFITESILPSYLFILLYAFFFIFSIQYINKYKQQLSKIASIPFFIFVINIVYSLELNTIIIPIIYCLALLISNIFDKKKEEINSLQTISSIFSIIGFLIILVKDIKIILIFSILYIIIYYILSILNKKAEYQLVSYAFVIAFFLYFSKYLEDTISLYSYILPISSLVIYLLNVLHPNPYGKNFLRVLFILGFINLLVPSNSALTLICYFVLTTTYVLFIKENEENLNYLYVPFASYCIYFYDNTYLINNFDILFVVSLVIIGFLLCLIITTKDNRYMIMSSFLALITVLSRDINKYTAIFILLTCFIIYYLYCDKKNQDLFKAGIYILITILLRFLIGDLGLEHFTVLRVGIYVISFILISRTILQKHFQEYKISLYQFSTYMLLIYMK